MSNTAYRLLFCWCLMATTAWGQRRYVNEYLNIGAGARALGMGNTQAAFADDATAGYWNPAGLLNARFKHEVAVQHASYFAGIANYDYAAYATPIDNRSALGISAIRFAVDNIPDTRFLFDADGTLNYSNVRSFSAADYGFLLSYARKSRLIKGLRVGGNAKIIHRTAGAFANAWGFGIDMGAQWDNKKWFFGVMARDITTTITYWRINTGAVADVFSQTGNQIPQDAREVAYPRLLADIGRKFRFSRKRVGVSVAAGADVTFDGPRNTLYSDQIASADPRAGLEIDYKETVYLRAGINNFQRIRSGTSVQSAEKLIYQPNFGIGVVIKKIFIDYALTNPGDQGAGLYSHIFSLRFGVGKNVHSPRMQEDMGR